MKLLCSLQRKLVSMELRHQSREQELQQVDAAAAAAETLVVPRSSPLRTCPPLSWQVIGRSWQRSESDERSQVECWRRVAEDKRRQLESFRQELDSILDMVRCLQRQGVVLPIPAASTSPHLTAGLLKDLP